MHDWQVNQRVHLYYASEQGLCPKNKNHPIFGWMFIIIKRNGHAMYAMKQKKRARRLALIVTKLFNDALFNDDIRIYRAFARGDDRISFFRSFIKFETFQISCA